MIEFRPYRPGDEHAILRLFETAFQRPMSLDFWRWRYLDHPAGGPQITLGFEEEALACHYAVSWGPLAFSGERVPAALSMTTMTDPAYRGRGLFEKSATALYDRLTAEGVGAVHGFPNAASHPLFNAKLGWADHWEIPMLTLDLDQARAAPPDPAVREVAEIDARFGPFCAAVARDLPISGERGREVLAWRLDRNPENRYVRLVLDAGEEIAGYAILKPYGAEAMDLAELRCFDVAGARALISAAVARAASEGRRRLATWCLPRETHRLALEAVGFKALGPTTYFGGRPFGPLPADLSDGRLWRVSMLDSDLY